MKYLIIITLIITCYASQAQDSTRRYKSKSEYAALEMKAANEKAQGEKVKVQAAEKSAARKAAAVKSKKK